MFVLLYVNKHVSFMFVVKHSFHRVNGKKYV